MLSSKSVVNTCAVMKNRRSWSNMLTNVSWVRWTKILMAERNKDGPFPSPASMWIAVSTKENLDKKDNFNELFECVWPFCGAAT